MRQYDASNLVVHPGGAPDPDVVVEVTPERAGWETIHFQVRRLGQGRAWSFATGEHELALVVLGGRVGVESGRGNWPGIGQRRESNCYGGMIPSRLPNLIASSREVAPIFVNIPHT